MDPGTLIKRTRASSGLSQQKLAERLGTTQSAVARLERRGGGMTVKTLERVMAALDKELVVDAVDHKAEVDETLIAANLRLSPSERLDRFSHGYETFRRIGSATRVG